jgi:putative DNA primase/helicase
MTTPLTGLLSSLTGLAVAGGTEPIAVPFSEIPAITPAWLWPGVIPERTPVILASPGGTGKGLAIAAIAGLVTTGSRFPGEPQDAVRERRQVILVAPEDDANEDLAFRLRAAGADLALVRVLNWMPDGTRFTLPSCLETLRDAIRQASAQGPPVGLVAVDPLLAVCERSIASVTAARAVIEPLQDLAREEGVAMIISHHTTKDGRTIAGSKAITDAARLVWLLERMPGSSDALRKMTVQKSNRGSGEPVYLLIEEDGTSTRAIFLEAEQKARPGSRAAKLRLGEKEPEGKTAEGAEGEEKAA